ncbi:hypothetical protein [Bacillus amyloliquefaciens]|uniref:hypothetical protein n=1 Tax=Bacillus amyloliquefaciens TaxID=1390 RepID=UPI0028092E18|nr:hypothetical protein [Bacillus amyloliquefaciens]MDQ8094904.1 hypothetical protein [Bacillus amyloliquefaciens]
MARSRSKTYELGGRIQVYLSKDMTPEFLEWINKQSDLSSFFLYAAQQLYKQTGFVDVSEVMPRKIDFDISKNQTSERDESQIDLNPQQQSIEEPDRDTQHKEDDAKQPKEKEETAWGSLDSLDDDPFA